jgi:hypothetical protein
VIVVPDAHDEHRDGAGDGHGDDDRNEGDELPLRRSSLAGRRRWARPAGCPTWCPTSSR